MRIFYLCSCDAWKSKDSMRLMFIGTSFQKLKAYIAKHIESGDFIYESEELSTKEQVNKFKVEFINLGTFDHVKSKLDYAYLDYTFNNQEV